MMAHTLLVLQNVLLTADHAIAKIGDVGLSRVLHSTYTGNASNNVGTFTYAAPEAILGEKCDARVCMLLQRARAADACSAARGWACR